ncbi:MAG TPA: hypothetical protein VIU11_29030 [Nakamurella sp.]
MSSVQYSLCSTAGLDTVTDTPDSAAAALVRHLSEVGSSRSVDWMITGPGDRVHHGRFSPPVVGSSTAAVADHVDAVHGQLLRDAARMMYVGAPRVR